MTRRGRYVFAAVAGTLLMLTAVFLAGCGSGSSGDEAAPDFTGTTLDGVNVSLSEYGGKPLVLAFMASW